MSTVFDLSPYAKVVKEEDGNKEYIVYETPKGKQVEVFSVPNSSLLCIKFNSGGERPKEFAGSYTTGELATRQIEKYFKRMSETEWKEDKTEELIPEPEKKEVKKVRKPKPVVSLGKE